MPLDHFQNTMKGIPCILISLMLLFSCTVAKEQKQEYLRWVGDIVNDPKIDDQAFKLCLNDSSVYQYFNVANDDNFEGEMDALYAYFRSNYTPIEVNESGWIRIRFIVNCHGETDRFRIIESDENYIERPFNSGISDQLLALTQSLQGWHKLSLNDYPIDYYQYLVFKINQGKLEEILP